MIDSGEVKDSNVSIMEEWRGNGYKEEGDTKRDRLRAILNQESMHECDFANASYFFKHHNQQVINITNFW